jgi:hypothetical protein
MLLFFSSERERSSVCGFFLIPGLFAFPIRLLSPVFSYQGGKLENASEMRFIFRGNKSHFNHDHDRRASSVSGFPWIDSGLMFDERGGLQVPGTIKVWTHSRTTVQLTIAQSNQTRRNLRSNTRDLSYC